MIGFGFINRALVPAEGGEPPSIPSWLGDEGVLDLTTATWLLRVAGEPGPGEYCCAAGTYRFSAAEAGHEVQIHYEPDLLSASARRAP